MDQLKKKNIARLVLQGISILGIFFGFTWFCCPIAVVLTIHGDNLDIDALGYAVLILSGALSILGVYLIYTSYLTLRGRSFEAIQLISVFLALTSFGLVQPLVSASGKIASFLKDIAGLASLLFLVLVYLICVKLLKRLVKAANVPKNISGTQHSTDKQ
jgi:hypothetical protein